MGIGNKTLHLAGREQGYGGVSVPSSRMMWEHPQAVPLKGALMEVWEEEVGLPPQRKRKELTGLSVVFREVKGICKDLIVYESEKTSSRELADLWGHLPATPRFDS